MWRYSLKRETRGFVIWVTYLPSDSAIDRRLNSIIPAMTMEKAEMKIPTPIRCRSVMPVSCPVILRRIGTRSLS